MVSKIDTVTHRKNDPVIISHKPINQFCTKQNNIIQSLSHTHRKACMFMQMYYVCRFILYNKTIHLCPIFPVIKFTKESQMGH